MSKQTQQSAAGGVGFFGWLALIFITLKLCGVITWPWWIILAPLWGPVAFVLALAVILLVVAGICLGVAKLLS
jgi:hypothetical protein